MPSDNIHELYLLELGSRDLSFIFFGYSGIICRSKYGVVAIDLGSGYDDSNINAIENLDFLLITHSHWNHFNKKNAIKIVEKTGATIVAEPNVAKELNGDSGYMQVGSQNVDVAFLPVGLPSPTCTPEIALAMTKWLKPKIVIPMHGKAKQMSEFTKLVGETRPRTKVVIPELFEPVLLSLK